MILAHAVAVLFGPLLSTPFEITARSVVAHEGGPLVLEFTATYRGRVPLTIGRVFFGDPFILTLPDAWLPVRQPTARFFFLSGSLTASLRPGDTLVKRVALHRRYACYIPPGEAIIQVGAAFSVVDDEGNSLRVIRTPVRPVVVQISPWASPDRDRLIRDVTDGVRALETAPVNDATKAKATELADLILDTGHPELVPAALALHRLDHLLSGTGPALCAFAFKAAPSGQINRQFVDHVLSDRPVHAGAIFDGWAVAEPSELLGRIADAVRGGRTEIDNFSELHAPTWASRVRSVAAAVSQRRHRLADEDLNRLLRADDFAFRTFVYLTFPDRLSADWVRAYEAEVGTWYAGTDLATVRSLVRKLDADDFDARQAASEELGRLLHRGSTWGYLVQVAAGEHSPEVEHRIRTLLSARRSGRAAVIEGEMYESLVRGHTAAHRRVRELIAAVDPNARIILHAQAIESTRRKSSRTAD